MSSAFIVVISGIVIFVFLIYALYFLTSPSKQEIERHQKAKNDKDKALNKYMEGFKPLLKLPFLSKDSIAEMSPSVFSNYLKPMLFWQMYKKEGGIEALSSFSVPIEEQFVTDIFKLLNIHRELDFNYDAATKVILNCLQGAEYAENIYVEYGFPKGFDIGSPLFCTFLDGYCQFISSSGELVKINALDITKSTLITSANKVKLRINMQSSSDYSQFVIFSQVGADYDANIAIIDRINKRVLEQKSIAKRRSSIVKINVIKLLSELSRIKDLASKNEQLISTHALLEKSLKELFNNTQLTFIELLNQADSFGVINNRDGIQKARKYRNKLAHDGNISEDECNTSLHAYQQSIESLGEFLKNI